MNIVFMSMDTLPSTLWARDLYDQMHIRSDFRKWFPRMCQYGFIEGRDYEYMPRVRLQDEGGRTVQRYVKDYRISQDMAKKLCKLHHTTVGAMYHPQPFDWDVLLGLLHKKPPRRSGYEAQLSDSDSLVTTTQIAKEYGCGAKVFNRLLHLHGIQYRANGQWVLYSEHHGKGYLRDPAIVIRKDSITFNTACITGLEDVVYVHVMFNNDLKRIVVRGCDENDKDALRWCVAKPDKRKSRKMSCKPFATLVYQKMGWDSECRYKMLGYRITFEGETLYVFDLLVPEIFHEGQRKKNAVDSQDNAASTKPVNSRKGFYLDDIVGTFGVPVEEHRKESEVKQMDGYVSMGILTGKIAPEAGKD